MFPNKMLKSNVTRALILLAVAVVALVVLQKFNPVSTYAVKEKAFAPIIAPTAAPKKKAAGVAAPVAASDCEMKAGTGLASSFSPVRLHPRRTSESSLPRIFSPVKTSLKFVIR